jgi:hypothetical protein
LAPGLSGAFNPWDEIINEQALRDLLDRGGVVGATAQATIGECHELDSPDDFWDVVLGSGLRATVDALDQVRAATLRRDVVADLRKRGITRLHNDVVFGTAVKSQASRTG